MPLVVKDRVKETTNTVGTGSYTLAGAVTGFQSFSAVGDGNTTYYCVTNGVDWEVGVGTYTASGTSLSRDTILESSNSGSAVNWSAGTKDAFVTYPAERAVYGDGSGTLVSAESFAALPIGNGGTGATNAGNAINALLPSQTGKAGQYLTTSGADPFWSPVSGGLIMYAENSTAAVLPSVSGSASIAAGNSAVANATASVAISGYVTSFGPPVLYATAIGQSSSGNLALTTASGAMSLAGAYATGVDGFAAATGGINGAQGASSVAIGGMADALHNYSFAIGNAATTTTTYQIALGGTSDSVRISGAYTLPSTDGSASQVLQTDGAGNVSWQTVGGGSATLTIQNKTSAYTVVSGDLGTIINCTSGTFTVALDAAATLGAGFNCWIWNTSPTDTHSIIINPSGSETIDGVTTLTLRHGEGTQIVCDGTNWQTGDKKTMRGYADNMQRTVTRPVASGLNAVAIGGVASATTTYAVALGQTTTASGYASVALGRNASATSNYSTAIGQNSSDQGSQAVTGAGAMALGGSYASGTDSFAAAITSNSSSFGAKGYNSIALGRFATATSAYAVAIGDICSATASNATAIGQGCSATASNAIALGTYASAAIVGKFAVSSDAFAAGGDSQTGVLVVRIETADATPTALTSDLNTASTNNQVILPNNSAYAFSGTLIARQQAAGGSDYAAWEIKGAIIRDANAASTSLGTYNINVLSKTAGASAWDVALSADTTNGGLAITVTGAAATNIRWVATVQTSEVTYA